jgi:hypothetical protein
MNTQPEQGISDSARELLAVTTRLLSEQQRANQPRRLISGPFSSPRKKEVREQQLELSRKLISSAGIDIGKIEEHQARSRLANRKHLERQAEEAVVAAAEISKRHVAATKERVARLQSLTQFGAATDYALLKVATSIDSEFKGTFNAAPLENVARFVIEMKGDGPFAGKDPPFPVHWHFSYTPPRTGLLNVVSSLLVNGFVWLETDPIFLLPSSASFAIGPYIRLFQAHQAMPGVPLQDAEFFPSGMADVLSTAPGNLEGETRTYGLDAQRTLAYNNQFIVVAGLPVDIVVQVDIDFDEVDGHVILDFRGSPYSGLNVPFVLAALS